MTLLGPNGAGKTTTIEILEGMRRPSAGSVDVLGSDPLRAGDAWRARVGIVMQSWRDHARWSPRDLLAFMGSLYSEYGTVARPRPRDADTLLDLVGLADKADAKIRTLSGGQRRRLDVAVGIVGRPEVLFLDEPTAGLDPDARRGFHELIHALVDEEETTVLLTTHDLGEAERLADRVVILAGGRIVADATADALADTLGRETQVRWSLDGHVHVHATHAATRFVRDLLNGPEGSRIGGLEVRRPSLEDSYLALVDSALEASITTEEAA
ncbi:ABC transporter ATP-binding protein [Demequina litorisediminis]|uniref:ABC transporter ATP-binding protein n=1 Tax=Demequina litorisediminis TaxID=1849022 RepID=UPI0024E1087C|nr:ABC transporter ATP-binding protein [Demequina litorisediminis]